MHTITNCQANDIPSAAGMLARAFLLDPLYQYIFADLQTREEQIAWDMAGIVRYGMRFGEVKVTPDLAGCAIWLPPGETDFTEERMREAGMGNAAAVVGREAEARMMSFVEVSEVVHRRLVPSDHWYLVILGVNPDRQGEGIGRALLAGTLARADEAALPVYLETLNHANLAFYARSGFTLRHTEAIPGGGPDVWYLVRDPARG